MYSMNSFLFKITNVKYLEGNTSKCYECLSLHDGVMRVIYQNYIFTSVIIRKTKIYLKNTLSSSLSPGISETPMGRTAVKLSWSLKNFWALCIGSEVDPASVIEFK